MKSRFSGFDFITIAAIFAGTIIVILIIGMINTAG